MLQKNGLLQQIIYGFMPYIRRVAYMLDSDVMLYGDLSTLFDADFVSAVEYHPTVNDKKTNLDLLDSKFNRVGNSKKVFELEYKLQF